MRQLNEITVGRILNDLWEELAKAGVSENKLFYVDKHNVKQRRFPITRLMFVKLEKRLNFPQTRRKRGKYYWRVYSEDEYNEIKTKIKTEYKNFAQLLL